MSHSESIARRPMDSLEELLYAVEDGFIPLEWIVRHGDSDRDPILVAYEESNDPIVMRCLLWELGVRWKGSDDLKNVYCRPCLAHGSAHDCSECVRKIKSTIPAPPTIDHVLKLIAKRGRP